jgi:hypothetical protein
MYIIRKKANRALILASILWRSLSSAARRSLNRRRADAMAAAWMVPQTSWSTINKGVGADATRLVAVKINKLAGAINTHRWQIYYLAGLLVRA